MPGGSRSEGVADCEIQSDTVFPETRNIVESGFPGVVWRVQRYSEIKTDNQRLVYETDTETCARCGFVQEIAVQTSIKVRN